jgi:Uma2 family endonuclease
MAYFLPYPQRDHGDYTQTAAGVFWSEEVLVRAGTEKKLFTIDELDRMEAAGLFEEERVELVHGEIFLMPKGSRHQSRVDRLTDLVTRLVRSRAIVRVQGPLFIDKYNLPEPDLMLLERRADFYERSHPTPEDVLLLVEVSDSSIEHDRDLKVMLYAIAGVREYWIEDIHAGELLVYRDPANDGYKTSLAFQRGQSIRPLEFPDIDVSVDSILG